MHLTTDLINPKLDELEKIGANLSRQEILDGMFEDTASSWTSAMKRMPSQLKDLGMGRQWHSYACSDVHQRYVFENNKMEDVVSFNVYDIGAQAPYVKFITKKAQAWAHADVLSEELTKTVTRKKTATKSSSKEYANLIQDMGFVAFDRSHELVAFWDLRVTVQFPLRKPGMAHTQAVKLKLEVIKSFERASNEKLSNAFANMIVYELESSLLNLSSILKIANQKITGDYDFFTVPLEVKVAFPQEKCDVIQSVFDIVNARIASDGHSESLLWNLGCLVINKFECKLESVDEAIEKVQEIEPPKPKVEVSPGDQFIFLEFKIEDFVRAVDGRFYRCSFYEEAEYFERQFGCSPWDALECAGLDLDEISKLEEYDDVMNVINEAEDCFEDFEEENTADILRRAISYALPKKGKQKDLWVRLLVDVSTNVAYAELAKPKEKIELFFNRATSNSSGSVLSAKPINLKISQKLLKDYPDIRCEKNGVGLAHPKHGFDSGAHIIKQWRHDLYDVLRINEGDGWWAKAFGPTEDQIDGWLKEHCKPDRYSMKNHYSGATNVDNLRYSKWLNSFQQ